VGQPDQKRCGRAGTGVVSVLSRVAARGSGSGKGGVALSIFHTAVGAAASFRKEDEGRTGFRKEFSELEITKAVTNLIQSRESGKSCLEVIPSWTP